MRENLSNSSYYALVWKDSLDKKGKIKGELITKNTVLPDDPRILYGLNDNDIAKIRNVEMWKEIEYDTLTTKQTVRYYTKVKEYVLCRDVRIIVWQGDEELRLPSNDYKIVSPELFEIIAQVSNNFGDKECKEWRVYGNPVEIINNVANVVYDIKDKVSSEINGNCIVLAMRV